MSRYGGFGRPIRGKGRGVSWLSSPSLKEMGSGAANPGLLPIKTPGTPMALKTNLSDVNGSTQQISSSTPKYKYKYKYPSDSLKRKWTPGDDPDGDQLHMQQKAAPGEQYRGGAAMRVPPYKKRKMPGIEPRSVPGDQYEEGASVNTEADKDRTAETQDANQEANVQFGKIVGLGRTVLKGMDLFKVDKMLPPHLKHSYDLVKTVVDQMSQDSFVVGTVMPILREAEEEMAKWVQMMRDPNTNDMDRETYNSLMKQWYDFSTAADEVLEEKKGRIVTNPKGVGIAPGESSVPLSNVESVLGESPEINQDMKGQGKEPLQAYGGEEQKAAPGGDPNRTDPITPATGSRQTSATANSLVSIKQVKAAAERTTRELGPEAVHGNARERANMGKGALDTYEFQGPYDYPVYPGGRPDDTLTMMGAWRTNGGNDSSLWYSKKTAKGANAKRNKYFKWSTKGGGGWRKLSKDDMVNVIQKGGQNDNRFYGTRTNLKFIEFQRNRDRNVALARAGNARVVESEHGDFSRGRNKYVGANKIGVSTSSDVPSTRQTGKLQQASTEGPSETPIGTNITSSGAAEPTVSASGVLKDEPKKLSPEWEEAHKLIREKNERLEKQREELEKLKNQGIFGWF